MDTIILMLSSKEAEAVTIMMSLVVRCSSSKSRQIRCK